LDCYLFVSFCRFFRGNGADSDSLGLPNGGDGKREHGSGKKYGPLISGTAYCISSCGMILLNKIALSTYNFNAGISLMFYQVRYTLPLLSSVLIELEKSILLLQTFFM